MISDAISSGSGIGSLAKLLLVCDNQAMVQGLFVYGTLQFANIVGPILGYIPAASPAILSGWVRLRVKNQNYPGILPLADAQKAGLWLQNRSEVSGLLYVDLTSADLQTLDRYEGVEYERQLVGLRSNQCQSVWTYVFQPSFYRRLLPQTWESDDFLTSL
jgi:hypothetical protein